MALDLSDPEVAQAIVGVIDQRVAAALAALPRALYGTVTAVDAASRSCSVTIDGAGAASAGFAYGPLRPAVDDRVRVFVDGDDRYIESVLWTGVSLARRVAGRLAIDADSPNLDLDSSGANQYAAIRFLDSGALRAMFDYATGTSDDVRLLSAAGAAGAETVFVEWLCDVARHAIEFGGRVRRTNAISPGISGNVNDYTPAGLSAASVLRIGTNGSYSITGIAAGQDGDELLVSNSSPTFTLTLAHLSASSAAANRIMCPGATNFSLTPYRGVWLRYDGISSLWRVVG